MTGCKKDNILELPITYHKGFSPFEASTSGASLYIDDKYLKGKANPWKKTYLKVSGVPQNWTDAKVGHIQSDMEQYVYQNYYLGDISKEWYDRLQDMWNWDPDTLNLSKEPIKTRVAFAVGNDSVGNTMVVIDENNNYDFSDEKPFELVQSDSELDWNSWLNNEAIYVTFERLLNDKKIQVEVPLLFSSANMDQYYINCYFAQYRTAKLENHIIYIYSRNIFPFREIGIASSQSLTGDKIDFDKVAFKNEYLEIGNDLYKNLGVNRNKDVLLLEKMDLSKNQMSSTKIGDRPFNFSEKQFQKQNMISLDSLKGKYVLLEFWDTWCGPCIKEIPNLKTIYNKTDKSKFEIIGIVGKNEITVLEKFANKHGITWPQIIDYSNKIKEKYGVRGIPATFLINPEGIIIAKNLRGKELETKIDSLINKASR
jgi:peroxiredoxin